MTLNELLLFGFVLGPLFMVALVFWGARQSARTDRYNPGYYWRHSRLVEWLYRIMVLAVIICLLLVLSAWLFHLWR